jgi:outer membrane murein-binding lipoprotein Lpp
MRRLTVSGAVLSLFLVAGCSDADTDAGAGSGTAAKQEQGAVDAQGADSPEAQLDDASVKAENMIADCMKKKGFQYVPQPSSFVNNQDKAARYSGPASVLEPPEQVRAFRAKYGFGGPAAQQAYPKDPMLAQPAPPDPSRNPNNGIREALDPARQKAYDKALEGDGRKEAKPDADRGCGGEAALKFYGQAPTGQDEIASAREYRQFQTDPATVAAAQKYADCLKSRGYKITSAQPGKVEREMAEAAMVPVSGSSAQAALAGDIKAALDDLDCRADYATVVRDKWAKAVRSGGAVG